MSMSENNEPDFYISIPVNVNRGGVQVTKWRRVGKMYARANGGFTIYVDGERLFAMVNKAATEPGTIT